MTGTLSDFLWTQVAAASPAYSNLVARSYRRPPLLACGHPLH